LIVTADQADAGARKKKSMDESNFSDDKRKDGHLDCRLVINQTDEEKAMGVQRLAVTYHRHIEFNKKREVIITQNLALGQPVLDSEWYLPKKGVTEED